MPMIQGIDGGALLQAFRAGRSDRYAVEEQERTRRKEEADAARQEQLSGLMGNLFGGQPATVSQQFGAVPDAVGSEPAEAPSAPHAPQPPRREVNRDVLQQLIILDPETGGRVALALKSMDEMDLKRVEARNNFMGAAARYVAQGRTPEERLQRFQIATPQLIEAGYTPEELDGIDNDLSDQRLQFYMATAIDYDKMIDNELAEREFNAGKTVPVTAGGSVALVKPNGEARYIIGGAQGGDTAIPQAAADHLRQHPELRGAFDEKYGAGAADSVLGGPTGSTQSAPFPG